MLFHKMRFCTNPRAFPIFQSTPASYLSTPRESQFPLHCQFSLPFDSPQTNMSPNHGPCVRCWRSGVSTMEPLARCIKAHWYTFLEPAAPIADGCKTLSSMLSGTLTTIQHHCVYRAKLMMALTSSHRTCSVGDDLESQKAAMVSLQRHNRYCNLNIKSRSLDPTKEDATREHA